MENKKKNLFIIIAIILVFAFSITAIVCFGDNHEEYMVTYSYDENTVQEIRTCNKCNSRTTKSLEFWKDYLANDYSTAIDRENKVITISSPKELALFCNQVNNNINGNWYAEYTIKLTDDIDLQGYVWTPIYRGAQTKGFIFDGQNHTIKNLLTFNFNGNRSAGLFGSAYCSTIKNLTIDNGHIEGVNQVGGIVGYGMCAHLENCTVKNTTVIARVKNNDDGDKVGGICGYLTAQQNASLTNCSADNVTISGLRDVGGLVGYGQGTTGLDISNNTIKNSIIILDKTDDYTENTDNSQYNIGKIIGRKDKDVDQSNSAVNVEIK